MPLPAELEKLLTFVPEAEREAYRKNLTETHEGALRQEDYSRKMNELGVKQREWTDWHQRVDTEYKANKQEVETLRQQVTELEKAKQTAIDDGLTSEEETAITKALKDARTELSQARDRQSELEAKVQQFEKDIAEGKLLTRETFQAEVTKQGDNLGRAIFDVIDAQNKCVAEYGKPLDRNQLIAEAQKLGGDIEQAYKNLTEEFRIEKIKADVEKEWQEKLNNATKGAGLPVDQTGGGEPSNLGPLQQRLHQQAEKKEGDGATSIPDDVPADGSGRLGSLIGQELRAEGKF